MNTEDRGPPIRRVPRANVIVPSERKLPVGTMTLCALPPRFCPPPVLTPPQVRRSTRTETGTRRRHRAHRVPQAENPQLPCQLYAHRGALLYAARLVRLMIGACGLTRRSGSLPTAHCCPPWKPWSWLLPTVITPTSWPIVCTPGCEPLRHLVQRERPSRAEVDAQYLYTASEPRERRN